MRLIGKLTSLSVRQARRRGLYGDGGGLFLQVSESGAKSWVFRFKKADRLRVMGLGPAHTITLAEARDRARECRKLRLDGIDPTEARGAMAGDARHLRQSDVRRAPGSGDRHGARHEGYGADLDQEA
jgi:hypothetical protein